MRKFSQKELLSCTALFLFTAAFIYVTFIDSYLEIRADVRREMMVTGWDEEKELKAVCEEFRSMPKNRKFLLVLQTEELVKVIKQRHLCDEVFK